MAIENTYLLGKNITLGCGFDLQAKAPLDSRQTVPSYAGLQALIDGNAAYEGMIVYDEETKKTYQAQLVDGALAFREFGINEAELKDLIASETTAAMEFKGVAAALPASGAKGDVYKVSAAFTVEAANDAQAAGFDAKIGDSIVCDGDGKWFLIPSGDDIEDTWRPVTDVNNDATLTFAAGDKLDVAVAANGTVTYSHEAIDAPTATPVGEDEQTRTYITSVETDGHGHITGYKTATEVVEDTNTEYTFEGQSDEATSVYFQVTSNEEGSDAEVIYLNAYSKNEVDEKLDAIEADMLPVAEISQEDFSNLLYATYATPAPSSLAVALDEAARKNSPFVIKVIATNGTAAFNILAETSIVSAGDEMLSCYTWNFNAIEFPDGLDNDGCCMKDVRTFLATRGLDPDESDAWTIAVPHDVLNVNSILNGSIEKAKLAADVQESLTKANSAAVKTEVETALAGKVDKVDDKDLIATSEIARLAAMSDGANKVEKSDTNGNIKVDGAEVVVYTHPDKHAIADVDGLQAALDGKQAAGDYAAEVHTHVKADITDFAHTHTVDEVTDFDAKVKAYDYSTKTEAQAMADGKDAAIQAAQAAADKAQGEVDALETYVGTIPTNYTETNVIAYINKKAEETLAAAQGGSSETAASVKQQLDNYKSENDTRVKTAEDAIDALEEASAKHALKTEVEAVDAKFANYNTTVAQKAIDDAQDARIKAIEDDYVVAADIANFETKANVKQVADDLAAYEQSNDAALAEVKATAEAARTEDEVNSQIDTKIAGLNLATTYEPIGAETRAKAYADGLISDANLAQYTTEQEVKDIVDGVIAGAVDGDTITGLANLVEYLNTHGGEAAEMGAAIDVLEGKVEVIEGKPAYGITATQISNWDNEVGAKALAETKLDAATFNAYNEAHANDYTNKQIDDAIDADVKVAIDAEVERANGAYDTHGAAAQALVDAKAYADSKVDGVDLSGIATNAAAIEDIKDGESLNSFSAVELSLSSIQLGIGDQSELKPRPDTIVAAINHVYDEVDAIKDHDTVDSFADVMAEVDKKVDKVEGKSLIADTEITRLAGMSDGANKVEASENGKIKIDGVDTVVYTHPDAHEISEVTGLQDALDLKANAVDVYAKTETYNKTEIEALLTWGSF